MEEENYLLEISKKSDLAKLLIQSFDNTKTQKIIFHIDVNNAYLSWTAVDLLNTQDIDIRNIPAVIGGDETKRSGVVLARSVPARKMGVKTGEPLYFALKKVPSLKIYKPNFLLYENKSNQFNNLLYKYTPIVEKYSIDESFLDVTEYLLGNTPLELANNIKKDIYDTFGFTVNIGISDSKMLAKTASDFKKPNMIHTLFSTEIKNKLWPLDISFLFSVGKKTQTILRNLQINTIEKLAKTKPEYLEQKLGKNGIKLWKLANGIDDSIIVSTNSKPKSISHAETLSSNLQDKDLIKKQIIKLTEKVTQKLREENMCSKTVRLTLRDNNFKDLSKQKSFDNSTDNTSLIYNLLLELLDEIYNDQEIRLIGVSLENLCTNINKQIDLFSLDKKAEKRKRRKPSKLIKEKDLDNILDDIKEKYNDNIIKRARNITKSDKNKKPN